MKFRSFISILFLITFLASCAPGTAAPETTQAPAITRTQPALNDAIEIRFNPEKVEDGIILQPVREDNQYTFVSKGGKGAISTDGFASRIRTNYLYFRITDGFYTRQELITVEIGYLDEGDGLILFQYDSNSIQSSEPIYKTIALGYRLNSHTWKTASYVISDAAFEHRQVEGGDFRIAGEITPVVLSEIKISRGGNIPATPTPAPTRATPAAFPGPLWEKAIFTYYFYWYDAPNGVYDLTNTPVDYQTMSWRDVSWQLKQIKEIKNAGIDVMLPVYWYLPADLLWSQPGLVNLATALEQMRAEGSTPPAVGMFVDTTSFTGKDMREEANKQELYDNIKFFFTTIPQGYWALAENKRPIVWFYTANWPTAYDQTFIDFVYQHFQEDFGVRPYLVFEGSWEYPVKTRDGMQVKDFNAPHLKYDATYSWGGAVAASFSPQVGEIGPGYDDHAVEGRIPPTFVDRKNGETYKQNFKLAIQCGSPWLAIETWSEFMEGTEISETLQYGRQYLDLTKEFSAYFKQGALPEGMTLGEYGATDKVSFTAGEPNQQAGLSIGPNLGDGIYITVSKEGKTGVQAEIFQENDGAYLFFQVDNAFYFNTPQYITLSLTYYDEGNTPISLDYDSLKCATVYNVNKAYKRIDVVTRHNTLTWKTVQITLNDATFANNENNGTDFRLSALGAPLIISAVEIIKQ